MGENIRMTHSLPIIDSMAAARDCQRKKIYHYIQRRKSARV
ncbi:hypothetical protein [Irregularibacter muris]|nr:hypothetical protein [Irregularibacter muris]